MDKILVRSIRLRLANRCKIYESVARFSSTPRCFSPNNVTPINLTDLIKGQMFVVPSDVADNLDFRDVLPRTYSEQIKTLREFAFLCRAETLQAYECLNEIQTHSPVSPLRMVLWGKPGTGKTTTLCQLIYFAHTHDYFVITIRNIMQCTRPSRKFLKKRPDVAATRFVFRSLNRIDSPTYAQILLNTFKKQNEARWIKLSELKTTKTYQWSEIEATKEGQPLTDIIDLGLSAPYLATDCLGGLYRELRHYASSGQLKLLVAIDMANSLFGTSTLKRLDRTLADASDLSVVQELRKFLEPTWSNGLCALVADKRELVRQEDIFTVPICTPKELFGDEGIEKVSPFKSIETSLYSEKEAEFIHKYYCEKKWLTTPSAQSDNGRKQMYHLSGFNPHYFERLCAFN